VSILLVIALVVIVGFMAGFIPWQREAASPTISPVPQPTTSPGTLPSPIPLPAPAPTLLPLPTGDVKFGFAVSNLTGSGLSRTVTAQLNNTGAVDAHNVWAKVQAYIGGSSIRLNGQDYLRVDIGTLKAGDSVTKQVTLSFSIADSLKTALQGVHLEMTIFSDEHSEAFSYDYKP
jgi:uncharacterized protein (UPF0212 family)